MPRICIVQDCPSTKDRKNSPTLHKFPHSAPDRLQQWIEKLDLRFVPIRTSSICHMHFRDEDYHKVQKLWLLKRDVVPLEFKKSGRRILNKIPCPAWKSQEAGARVDSKSNVATSTNSDVIKGFEEFISVAAMSEDPLNWRRDCSVLLQPDGVCFYRLSSDMTSLNVSFSFRVIVSKEMRVAVFHRELEVECTKLKSWSQFRHLMDSCHSQPDVKVNTNPYHHIKRAQNCLLEINSSPEIDEVIEPIAQQLETAAGMFDPFTGEFSAVAQVSVKEEPAYFNKYDVETPAARFDPFNGEFSGVGQVSIKEEPMSIADDEEIFKPAAELKKEHSEYEIYQPLPFSPTVREEVKVKKPRKKYTRVKERKQTDPNQVFTCERCGLVFKDKAKLRDHCYNYHTGPYYCDLCGKILLSRKRLRYHMTMNHLGIVPFGTCHFCGEQMRNLQRHIRVRHEGHKPFACSHCDRRLSTKTLWKAHELTHIDKQTGLLLSVEEHERKYPKRDSWQRGRKPRSPNKAPKDEKPQPKSKRCPKCGRLFQVGDVLSSHIEQCEGMKGERKKWNQYKYPCPACGKNFVTKTKCAWHMQNDHNWLVENIEKFCFVCKEEVEDPLRHAKSHNCAFPCPQCVKRFLSQEKLDVHMMTHRSDEQRPFTCDMCPSTFKIKNHLASHVAIIHSTTEEKTFECQDCDKRFAAQFLLTQHAHVHSDVQRFCCRFCGKRYKWLHLMKLHYKQEHGVDAYPCHLCDVQLKTLNDLKLHLQENHRTTMNVQKYHSA